MSDTTSNKNSILNEYKAEFNRLAGISADYRKEMRLAKTNTKKQYFQKKLHKNNREAYKLLLKIERLRDLETTTSQDGE